MRFLSYYICSFKPCIFREFSSLLIMWIICWSQNSKSISLSALCRCQASQFNILQIATKNSLSSLFHMKITASVTKNLHQDCGPCYLHVPLLLYIHSPLPLQNNVIVIAVFLSKLDHRPLFKYIYYETILVWRLISVLLVYIMLG